MTHIWTEGEMALQDKSAPVRDGELGAEGRVIDNSSDPPAPDKPAPFIPKPYEEAVHWVEPQYRLVTFCVPLEDTELFQAFFDGAGIDPAFIEWTFGDDAEYKVLMEGSIEHRFSLWWNERYVPYKTSEAKPDDA